MSKQLREYERMVSAELASAGITQIQFETLGSGHRACIYQVQGRTWKHIYPSTPGDHRSMLNNRACLRRDIRKAKERT